MSRASRTYSARDTVSSRVRLARSLRPHRPARARPRHTRDGSDDAGPTLLWAALPSARVRAFLSAWRVLAHTLSRRSYPRFRAAAGRVGRPTAALFGRLQA